MYHCWRLPLAKVKKVFADRDADAPLTSTAKSKAFRFAFNLDSGSNGYLYHRFLGCGPLDYYGPRNTLISFLDLLKVHWS